MDGYEPHNLIGLIGLVIIIFGGALMATLPVAIPLWLNRHSQRQISRNVSALRNQVQNGHSTNMRDDLDKIHASVNEALDAVQGVQAHQWELSRAVSGLDTAIGQLRNEVTDERDARKAADDHITETIKLEINRHPSEQPGGLVMTDHNLNIPI